MSVEHRVCVTPDQAGKRLDRVLSEAIEGLSRARIQSLIDEERVTVNGRLAKASCMVREGDVAVVSVPEVRPVDLVPENLGVPVLYEDDDLVVVDKPRGMAVHPGAGVDHGTLVHALMYQCRDLSGIGGQLRPGIVHRLDRGTSGIMLAAKNDAAHERLARQFAERRIRKEYRAIVAGEPSWVETEVDGPIARHPSERKKMAIVAAGRNARTRFRVMASGDRIALVSACPLTGRTHQIRVHLMALGFPVLGDTVYGKNAADRFRGTEIGLRLKGIDGFCLHARSLEFRHPVGLHEMRFEARMPDDMKGILMCGGINMKERET